jgi:hypothetical protein
LTELTFDGYQNDKNISERVGLAAKQIAQVKHKPAVDFDGYNFRGYQNDKNVFNYK